MNSGMSPEFIIFSKLVPHIDGIRTKLLPDGKIDPCIVISPNTPWIHTVDPNGKWQCHLWLDICLKTIGFIHKKCMDCYKVVVRPQNVKQLFQLKQLQKDMGVQSKCGMEERPEVAAMYGGYFYTRSLEEGRKRYKEVRKMIDKHMGHHVPVLLKRACTEMEASYGPSDKWDELRPQSNHDALSDAFDEMVVQMDLPLTQPKVLKEYVENKWINWAHSHGDMTYVDITGAKLLPDYVTYHK